MHLSVDLSKLHPRVAQSVVRGLHHEDRAQYTLGVIEQLRLKKLADEAAKVGFNTDIGRTTMVMSEDQWKRAMDQYGQKCHQDPDFGKWLLKHNPEFRVKDVGTKIQSGWTPQSS